MYLQEHHKLNNAGPPETQPRERVMMESSSSTKGFTGYYRKAKEEQNNYCCGRVAVREPPAFYEAAQDRTGTGPIQSST
jgi:hypothetical protein